MFSDFAVARIFIKVIRSSDDKDRTTTLGFVVMPDHLHWVICLGREVNLCRAVGLVKGVSAFKINRQAGHRGVCWQDGFYDHALRRDEDLQRVMRYVLLNPVRAGLVKRIGDYPHWDCVYI